MHALYLRLLAGVAVLACIGATPKAYGPNLFLSVPGVTGPVTAKGLVGDIELLSASIDYPGTSGKKNPKATPFHFQKNTDETSPIFERALESGQAFSGDTILSMDKQGTGGLAVLVGQVKFHNAIVTEDLTDSNVESVSLTYDAVEVCTQAQSTTGRPLKPVCTSWDFTKGTPTYPK